MTKNNALFKFKHYKTHAKKMNIEIRENYVTHLYFCYMREKSVSWSPKISAHEGNELN